MNILQESVNGRNASAGKILFTLFITGKNARSQSAVANLRRICQDVLPDDAYELTIVDVLERPQLAEEARIIATPTLIKSYPAPIRKIIGDLSDKNEVLIWLDLTNAIDQET